MSCYSDNIQMNFNKNMNIVMQEVNLNIQFFIEKIKNGKLNKICIFFMNQR